MLYNLIEQIDNILPQTQCTRCGYPSCLDYASAISNNEAEINQCPPGGNVGIQRLAQLLAKPIMPLNPVHGTIKPRQIAVIEEDKCIGCTLCIKACPVDAIIGTNKMMHTVITDHCTGCDLCLPACPVDCIIMLDAPDSEWTKEHAQLSKERFIKHNERKLNEIKAREARLAQLGEFIKN